MNSLKMSDELKKYVLFKYEEKENYGYITNENEENKKIEIYTESDGMKKYDEGKIEYLKLDPSTLCIIKFKAKHLLESPNSNFSVKDRVKIKGKIGSIVNIGKVNGFDAAIIRMDEILEGKSSLEGRKFDYMFPVICLEKMDCVIPEKNNVYSYMKIGACVVIPKFGNLDGKVVGFTMDENTFKYNVEINGKTELKGLDEVKPFVVQNIEDFMEINDPVEFGIVTPFKLKTCAKVKVKDKEVYGDIAWMGFDADKTFKFGIILDSYVFGNEDNGTFFDKELFKCDTGYGALMDAFEVFPDDRFEEKFTKTPREEKTTQICVDEQYCCNTISTGQYFGIQGNRNSCYMDTSLFAMFTFTSAFDFMLNVELDTEKKKLQTILKNHIVYPLRKDGYVDRFQIDRFRTFLDKKFPQKKFYVHERDPEEFLETLLSYLIPSYKFYRTVNEFGTEQAGFCMQIFYTTFKEKTSIEEMLKFSFNEQNIRLKYPPRCLILQLPRNSTDYKNFEEVKIQKNLNITKFISKCDYEENCMNQITHIYRPKRREENFMMFCHEHCDMAKMEEVYNDGKFHELDKPINKVKKEVILKLIAVLCINSAHYTAFVNTGYIDNKWIYFNSMETTENDVLVPLVRDTKLDQYFKTNDSDMYDSDLVKLTRSAFVCFYINPQNEFLNEDINTD